MPNHEYPDAPHATKRKPKAWVKVQDELELKKAVTPIPSCFYPVHSARAF